MNTALKYLLDTNIISDLVRHPQGKVADCIARVGENSICTSIVVASEIRFGAQKRSSARLTAQVEAVLSALEILALDTPADRCYGALRYELEKNGRPIGPNDMLIAAHALSLDLMLITANVDEFSRVPNLRVDNWLN